jgi:tRNA G18 (ribose-2'-O)-methylase SpoU
VRLAHNDGPPSVTPIHLSSPDDPLLDPFRNLKGQGRRSDGTFVAESELVLERLMASPIVVRSILLTPARFERLGSQFGSFERRGSQSGGAEFEIYVASQPIIDAVVGYPLHRGVVAVAERPPALNVAALVAGTGPKVLGAGFERGPAGQGAGFERGPARQGARTIVVLEDVMDPENVGSVFRHAAGFGADAVILVGHTGDPLYRRTIRTSMGWTLEIPFAQCPNATELQHRLRAASFTSLALTPDPAAETLASVIDSLSGEQPVALWLGAEGPGLTDEAFGVVDRRVRIPLAAGVDSLNVATAAAIALYALTSAYPARIAPRQVL